MKMGIKIALCDLIPQACNHAPYYMTELVATGMTETANSEVSSMTHESFEEMDGMLTPPIRRHRFHGRDCRKLSVRTRVLSFSL